MKFLFLLFSVILSMSIYAQPFDFNYHTDYDTILQQTKDSTNDLHYDKLLIRFQSNDTTLTDFQVLSLLIGFSDNEHFKPYEYLETEREIYRLNDASKFEEALEMCDSFLTIVPLSQQALLEKSYALHKLGQADSASHYLHQFQRIMRAMMNSGDGFTPETAFFALGPADGQNFIKKYLSGSVGSMGSGSDKHGNFVDILEIIWENQDGEKQSKHLYFQIEHATKTMFSGMFSDEEKH